MGAEPSMGGTLMRLAAFTDSPGGGNPAGVWVGDALPSPEHMQVIAAEVGYSETAFVAPATGKHRNVRYFSPEAEVSFCGHATVAAAVAIAGDDGAGDYTFATAVGNVPVAVRSSDGITTAALTSVAPRFEPAPDALLASALKLLSWTPDELDAALPPAVAFAGAQHLVIAAAHRSRLDELEYSFDAMKSLMLEHDLTTLQLVWRESNDVFYARNPFPVGGVVEDPATGAAAAALGGYLREAGLVEAPARVLIHQGGQMGRPSRLHVEIPVNGGIVVRGAAVAM